MSVNGIRELCFVRGHFYFGTIQGARAIRNFGYKELRLSTMIQMQVQHAGLGALLPQLGDKRQGACHYIWNFALSKPE